MLFKTPLLQEASKYVHPIREKEMYSISPLLPGLLYPRRSAGKHCNEI